MSGPTQAEANGQEPHSSPLFTYAGTGPISVVCTTGMVADVVRHVGGEHVNVVQLMGAGVDPHLYQASPGDVRKMQQCDMIFYSGLHLEGKLATLFERMSRKKSTLGIADGLPKELLLDFEGSAADPHVWFDVPLWAQTVPAVQRQLSQFDPAHADDYRQRGDAYAAELAALHAEVAAELGTIPESHRVLVTAHDAFRYFGRAYGLEVRGIQGISTDSEAGVRQINDLVRFIAERKIPAVFVETSVSERNIQALVEGCQAQGHPLQIGGELYSDALGEQGTPEGSYAGMIRKNVKTLCKSLHDSESPAAF